MSQSFDFNINYLFFLIFFIMLRESHESNSGFMTFICLRLSDCGDIKNDLVFCFLLKSILKKGIEKLALLIKTKIINKKSMLH
jgi:hypothetical protein